MLVEAQLEDDLFTASAGLADGRAQCLADARFPQGLIELLAKGGQFSLTQLPAFDRLEFGGQHVFGKGMGK